MLPSPPLTAGPFEADLPYPQGLSLAPLKVDWTAMCEGDTSTIMKTVRDWAAAAPRPGPARPYDQFMIKIGAEWEYAVFMDAERLYTKARGIISPGTFQWKYISDDSTY